VRRGALQNFVGIVESDEMSDGSRTIKMPWEKLKADYRGWHPIIQTIIDNADKDRCHRGSLHNRPPINNWSTTRATLLGDSSHATLPYLAQGAVVAA
jgi:salicylate hydroxylase